MGQSPLLVPRLCFYCRRCVSGLEKWLYPLLRSAELHPHCKQREQEAASPSWVTWQFAITESLASLPPQTLRPVFFTICLGYAKYVQHLLPPPVLTYSQVVISLQLCSSLYLSVQHKPQQADGLITKTITKSIRLTKSLLWIAPFLPNLTPNQRLTPGWDPSNPIPGYPCTFLFVCLFFLHLVNHS